jgi:hypothetical protein
MPTGTMFMHQTIGSLFIAADDGRYYQPRPEVELMPGTHVTFQILNLTGAPPGFYFAENVVRALPAPVVAPTTGTPPSTAPKLLGAWGKPLAPSVLSGDNVSSSPTPILIRRKTVSSPALPTPAFTPRTLTNKQTREDFEMIASEVRRLNWGSRQGYGPSVKVTTKLKWDGEGRELYMRVLEEYQDRIIPGEGFYYYVGTMNVNWGKGGFRISAHTHPKASIGKSKTYSVLHVEN